MIDGLRISPGSPAHLAKRATDDTLGLAGKEQAEAHLAPLLLELEELQNKLWAEGTRSLLVVLQGIDSSGKDGVVRVVIGACNPAGTEIHAFKQPSSTDLAHDYLWRVHAETPERGHIGIFNRSHYESVLIERVDELVPPERWKLRYDHINHFESHLTSEGTTVVKFMLHISRAEQARRLQSRLDDPSKQWKFRVGDLADRKNWDKYAEAYEDALTKTSTAHAPWYVIPSDHKWVRNVAVTRVLISVLKDLDPKYPKLAVDPATVHID